MRDLFEHIEIQSRIVPGSDWADAVAIARSVHESIPGNRVYPNSQIRALGAALAGCVAITESDANLNDFYEAAIPPMAERDADDLSWGYRTVSSTDMKGVEHV